MIFEAQAPSNIALIKYMGKESVEGNRSTNASLSYTLPHLLSTVQIEYKKNTQDILIRWEPLSSDFSLDLSEHGQTRFMKFFEMLCREFQISGEFIIRSHNNFPSDCGLASSASSFAALTKCFSSMLGDLNGLELSNGELSKLSQRGSGSSCRSFFQPWAIWDREGAQSIDIPYANLLHDVVIVAEQKKLVSSSSAHQRVGTSLNFQGRVSRAEDRLKALILALSQHRWCESYELCWAEFWDMHSLFETSQPPFGYISSKSIEVLQIMRQFWEEHSDGPLVTMDAGPNIHLLWRENQEDIRMNMKEKVRRDLAANSLRIWGDGLI